MEDFLGWRAQKFNISCLLLFPLTLTTASAVLTLISGGKSTSSCCFLLSCPGLSLMPSRSTCQSQQIGWKVRTAIISTLTFFFFLLPFIPFSVLPQSHQKCKYTGMVHPQRWLKFTKKFYFIFARKKLGLKHLEWLTFIPLGKTDLMKINVLLQSQYFFQVLLLLSSAWGVHVGEWLERIFRKMFSGKGRDHRSDQWNFHRKENWTDLILSTRNLTSGTSYILLAALANKLL